MGWFAPDLRSVMTSSTALSARLMLLEQGAQLGVHGVRVRFGPGSKGSDHELNRARKVVSQAAKRFANKPPQACPRGRVA